MINHEGVVDSLGCANRGGTGWEYSVWIEEPAPTGRVLWIFDEAELESLRVVELESGERVPADDSEPPAELHDEVHLQLVTSITDRAEAEHVARKAEKALLEIITTPKPKVELDNRPWHEPPNDFYVRMKIEVSGAGLDTFDKIVAACRSGWTHRGDDGWRCDFDWSQDAGSNTVFLVPEVTHAWIGVEPWDNPRRRSGSDLRIPAV